MPRHDQVSCPKNRPPRATRTSHSQRGAGRSRADRGRLLRCPYGPTEEAPSCFGRESHRVSPLEERLGCLEFGLVARWSIQKSSSRGWIEEGFRPDARRCRKLFCIWRGRLPKEPDYSQRGGVGCTASWGRVEDCDRALADAKYVVVRNLRIKLSRAYKRGRACRPINLDD